MREIKMNCQESITFEEGCNLYLQNCKERNLREDTIRHYRQSYLRFYRYFDRTMEDYILTHGDVDEVKKNLATYEEMLLIAECHSRSRRYPAIKSWFLEMYPEVVSFGTFEEKAKILQIGDKKAA